MYGNVVQVALNFAASKENYSPKNENQYERASIPAAGQAPHHPLLCRRVHAGAAPLRPPSARGLTPATLILNS